MANASQMQQEITNIFKTELKTNFDIDMSQQCQQAVNASQSMQNIQLSGVKDVSFNQKNFVESRCVLNSILNLDLVDKLSANVKEDLLAKLEQKGGLGPGVNTSSSSQKATTIIENKVGLDAKLNVAKKCLQNLTADQSIKNIQIKDSLNVNLTQDAVNYNTCLMDGSVQVAKENGIDISKETKTDADIKQTGIFGDLAGALGGMLSMPIISSFGGVMVCCLVVVVSMTMSSFAKGSGEQKSDAPKPPPRDDEGNIPDAPPPPRDDGDVTDPEKETILSNVTDAATDKGLDWFKTRLGKWVARGAGKGGAKGWLSSLLDPRIRVFIVFFLIVILIFILFGKQNNTSPEIQQLEQMSGRIANNRVSGRTSGRITNQGTSRVKHPYPVYDPMMF